MVTWHGSYRWKSQLSYARATFQQQNLGLYKIVRHLFHYSRSKFVIHTAAVTGIAVVSVEFGPCSTVAALVLLFCDNVAYESDIISIAELSYLVSPTLGESVPRPPSAQHPQHWRSARGVPGQIGPLGGSGSRLCKLCISLISFKEVKQEGCWFCCSQLLGQLVI